VPAHLVAGPDQFAQHGLAGVPVEKAQFLRPDFAENDPAHSRLNHVVFRIAVLRLPAPVGIGQADPVMDFKPAVVVAENDFGF
jgi:hypothetical protein